MGRAKLVSLRVRHERKIEKEGAGCRPGTHNAGARDLARRGELAVGSMAVGAVRHPESTYWNVSNPQVRDRPVMRPSSEGVCDLRASGAGFCTS